MWEQSTWNHRAYKCRDGNIFSECYGFCGRFDGAKDFRFVKRMMVIMIKRLEGMIRTSEVNELDVEWVKCLENLWEEVF